MPDDPPADSTNDTPSDSHTQVQLAPAGDDTTDGGGGESGGGGDEGSNAANAAASAGNAGNAAPNPKLKTSIPRDKMSAFLVAPAQAAVKRGDRRLAVSIYRGLVTARGPGADEAIELAKMWTLGNQFDEAAAVLDEFIPATDDPDKMKWAQKERARLSQMSNPFAARDFEPAPALGLAKKAFTKGRAAFKNKQYADALVYYEMGAAMAPEAAGFMRELGATYDKLGARAKKIEFYQQYLRTRPFGKNAELVRRALKKEKGALGTLVVKSAGPCEEVWVSGMQVRGKLPRKGLKIQMAPGHYKALCYAPKYALAYFEYAKVEAGKASELAFNWAIVVNALKDPYGRIRVEDARAKGVMRDLGITSPELGIIVPDDGRALKFELEAQGGGKTEERYLKIPPGQREVIKW